MGSAVKRRSVLYIIHFLFGFRKGVRPCGSYMMTEPEGFPEDFEK